MDNGSTERRDSEQRKMRKRTELSLVIPFIAICLLVSPLLNGFVQDNGEAQLTAVIVYVFGVWGALILAAFLLSRLLNEDLTDD